MISNHLHYTGSTRAKEILDRWSEYRPKFRKVMPVEYRRALEEMERMRMGVRRSKSQQTVIHGSTPRGCCSGVLKGRDQRDFSVSTRAQVATVDAGGSGSISK